jgi:hypothetical protein
MNEVVTSTPSKVMPSIDKRYFVIRWFYFALKRLETSDSQRLSGVACFSFWEFAIHVFITNRNLKPGVGLVIGCPFVQVCILLAYRCALE